MEPFALLEHAKEASRYSYSPYSKFKVGAALLSKKGKVYCGTNVENASFGATICAERSALAQAVLEQELDFKAVAVYINQSVLVTPCGICRQALAEFGPDLQVFCSSAKDFENKVFQTYSLAELLPYSFHL